jgi:hypothetical protein
VKARDLKAIFRVARDAGVTRLRLGDLDVEFAPLPQVDLVAAINKAAPLPGDDPIAIVRGMVRPTSTDELPDILERMAEGGPIVQPISNDPTQPQ